MALQDLLVLTFKNCSKIVVISIQYFLYKQKNELFEALLKIKITKKENIFLLCS